MIKLKKKKTFCYVCLVFLHAKMVNWGIDEEKKNGSPKTFVFEEDNWKGNGKDGSKSLFLLSLHIFCK